uniref:RanBP-type and C3HC4-type zinc finger-containing protein 1 n=1 Tax=Dendroctonus ponderosae TaxID=77166 RepID=A0AAR5Q1I9_DENPD
MNETVKEQRTGSDPKAKKRISGLFAAFKWFKIRSDEDEFSGASRCITSSSLETVATDGSFWFVTPAICESRMVNEKHVPTGPKTDSYKIGPLQRAHSGQAGKNMTLLKKYSPILPQEGILKHQQPLDYDRNSKSLPLKINADDNKIKPDKMHRSRTNSELSKRKAEGMFIHVKGKRKAPQPPEMIFSVSISINDEQRLAAPNPSVVEMYNGLEKPIISNDCLKLENGILTPLKENLKQPNNHLAICSSPSKSNTFKETFPPRPWLPEVPFVKHLATGLRQLYTSEKFGEKKNVINEKEELPTNIRKCDKDKSEINQSKDSAIVQKLEIKKSTDDMQYTDRTCPKESHAGDVNLKFDIITARQQVKHLVKPINLDTASEKEEQLPSTIENKTDNYQNSQTKASYNLSKSETASSINNKNTWTCKKCNLNNEHWRVLCSKCFYKKTCFDDLSHSVCSLSSRDGNSTHRQLGRSKTQTQFPISMEYETISAGSLTETLEKKIDHDGLKKMLIDMKNSLPKRKRHILTKQKVENDIILERLKIPQGKTSESDEHTRKKNTSDTTELIEKAREDIPNKLDKGAPKLYENVLECKQAFDHNIRSDQLSIKSCLPNERISSDVQRRQISELIVGTAVTIYEKINVRADSSLIKENTTGNCREQVKAIVPELASNNSILDFKTNTAYQLIKKQDFEDIYSTKNHSPLYANLAQKDELSLLNNIPRKLNVEHSTNCMTEDSLSIDINRLFRRLEEAISIGDMSEAADLAKRLAQLQVNCSVIRHHVETPTDLPGFNIEMYIEDKISHRGPFSLTVIPSQTVAALKQQVFKKFQIPVEVQRWILGNVLVLDDDCTLEEFRIAAGSSVFLYLVSPDNGLPDIHPVSSHFTQTDIGTSAVILAAAGLSRNESELKIQPLSRRTTNLKGHISAVSGTTAKATEIVLPDFLQKKLIGQNNTQNTDIKMVDVKKDLYQNKLIFNLPSKHESKLEKCASINANLKTVLNRNSNLNVIEGKEEGIFEQGLTNAKVKNTFTPKQKLLPLELGRNEPSFHLDQYKTNLKKKNEDLITNISATIAPCFIQNEAKQDGIVGVASLVSNNSPTSRQVRLEDLAVNITCQTHKPKEIGTSSVEVTYPDSHEIKHKTLIACNGETNSTVVEDIKIEDSKTGHPAKEWECYRCTLLNPGSFNICEICGTSRLRKSMKKKAAPQPKIYHHLLNLDSTDLVANSETFECLICFTEVTIGEGVILRECLHQFCRDCLTRTVEFADDAEVKCPYRDKQYSCNIVLQDREIKALVPSELYEKYLSKSISQAENQMEKTFHCKTPNCKGWCTFEDNVNEFRCPICKKVSCLTCQVIHMGATCHQYQDRLKDESMLNDESKRTQKFLEEMVQKGEAIACPTCKVVLMKKWGCDWLRCSMCKTEICWVTRGPRWGPGGKGDTSGGCQCGVNGTKCHLQCNYCH